MGPETTGIEATVLLRMSHVPTGIVHLFEPSACPLVTYRLRNGRDRALRLRVAVHVEGYSARAVETVELPPQRDAPLAASPDRDSDWEVHLLPTFFPDAIARLTERTRATLHVEIDDLDGQIEQHSTYSLWLLPRSYAYFYLVDPAAGAAIDLTPYLGAWVTPNAPPILALLRRAAEAAPDRSLLGYLTDAAGVEKLVRAIYETLREERITYVGSMPTSGPVPGVFAQQVRLPRESLQHRSANCIDGTVLMASLLEAASMNPALVIVPGHAFLGWETGRGSGEWDYLETTLIGKVSFAEARRRGRQLAEHYQCLAQAQQSPLIFRRWSLAALRSQGFLPME